LCLSAGNRKNPIGNVLARAAKTLLSLGAPDCPVVRQASSSEVVPLGNSPASYGYNSPDCPVSQRSAGPTVGRAICAGHVADPTARRGHRTVRCAPDCPVCTGHVRCANGSQATNCRLRHFWKEIGHRTVSGVHRTVRCASRQKSRSAFLDCSQRLLAALGL
jgi:hypothetical protein